MGLQFKWKGFVNPEVVNQKSDIMMILKNQSWVTWENIHLFIFLYTLFSVCLFLQRWVEQ